MTDNDLIRAFLPILQTQLSLYGYQGVVVKQSNQPTQQGLNTAPTVYFYKLADHRYGWLRRADEWDIVNGVELHTEEQYYETRFTLMALVLQSPKITTGYTASDLVNASAAILQSDSTRATLGNSNVGILRIEEITNPYFSDDRDMFEASPSFDFVLTHRQTRVITTPVISSQEWNIFRV